ncbi:ATP-binding cassette sub-family C member 10 [Neocloeon triangulifer]|uniref:ATP-binding cassette sub-family C member 10 n=1 Tax=Neocloeon triangulifer TaxID=2078957 RepID=UPI00286F9A26|nr:ATP-binding cassette sub-family C member 10 [Neocloeon triangulifer]
MDWLQIDTGPFDFGQHWQWNWTEVCGSEGFKIWDVESTNFGNCFSILCVQIPVLVIFSAVSAYYCGKPTHRVFRTKGQLWTIWLRCVLVLLMAVLPIVEICLLTAEADKINEPVNYVEYLQAGVQVMTWFVHLGMCITLRNRLTLSSRGPALAIFLWNLTFLCDMLLFRSSLLHVDKTKLASDIGFTFAASTVAVQVFYLSTLLSSLWASDGLTAEQHASMLDSTISGHSYSQFQEDQDPYYLGVAADGASCLSRLFFQWVTPLMKKGVDAKLTGTDELFDLPQQASTRIVSRRFNDALSGQTGQDRKQRTLLSALHKSFGVQFYSIGVLKLLTDLAGFASPMLLNGLVNFIEDKSKSVRTGLIYAAGLFIATTIAAFCNAHFSYLVSVVGLKIRASLITVVYNKILKPSLSSLSELNMGAIVNYMSTDTDRIVNSCASFHAFWSIPFQIAVTLYLLYLQVGLAFLAGLAFSIILIPINKCIASKIGQLSEKLMECKDDRVKCVSEAISGIRVLKYHVWEDHFASKIKKLRNSELKYLKGRKYLDALCVYFWATTPVLISILTFTTYTLMGNKLTAAKVFTTIALLNMLIAPLNTFPWALNGLTEAWVSMKRIQRLLLVPDVDVANYYAAFNDFESRRTDVTVIGASFEWGHSAADENAPLIQSKFTLHDINIEVFPGQLVAVIGPVGSGKSSILAGLLAEMDKKCGSVFMTDLKDGFGYVAQQPWLQRGTIRDNILFGKTYEHTRYSEVLEACCLENDLQQLQRGDLTAVGESGSTLSGGQRARVALARAVYQDKLIYLLDDILSAVDLEVARNIFSKCIMGLLKDKTRLLCTHNRNFLQNADWIVVVENGCIKAQGHPEEILENFGQIIEEPKKLASSLDTSANIEETSKNVEPSENIQEPEGDQREEQETGNIRFSVITDYWCALGHLTAVTILLSLLLMQTSRNLSDWWLSYWVTHISHNSTSVIIYQERNSFLGWVEPKAIEVEEVTFYLIVYGMIAGLNSIFTLVRAFLFAFGGIKAAASLHTKLLKSVLRGKVNFFDLTPAGRIINRFSSDTYTVDDSLPFILNILLAQFFGLIGSLVVTTYGLPWLSLVLVPLLPLYRWLQFYYRHTSRELKRIGSVALSPVYNHFNETLLGFTTIKAFRASERFSQTNELHLENSQKAQFSSMAASQWLGLRLQFFGVIIVGSVGLIAVVQHHYGYGVNPGLVGLAITYALTMTSLLNGVINAFTETEKEMIAVERTQQYIRQIEPEPQGETMPPLSYPWPSQGVIFFNSVAFQHRSNVPFSLKGVTFQTHPAEKVGIVGRTGAGKSSLFAALFRMNEIEHGQILIDAVNISNMGLRTLRSRLEIIPQEPFLFSGTLRENIDPLGQYSTPEIWSVIRKCHLEDVAFRLGSIDFTIGGNGRMLSVGQKQLVCLARAVLHNAKILCIDEATANVDNETDQHIQTIIRESFLHSTILTIAHRIKTVLDCDRVLVMGDGVVLEFDTPDALLQNPDSHLHRLMHEKL